MTPIECLEIWGLSVNKYPYDGYMCLKLEFSEVVVGIAETIETLVLVCPEPVMEREISIVVGTNTSIVRRLFQSCKAHKGDHFLSTLSVHPVIRQAYEKIEETPEDTSETKRGTVWFTREKPFSLPPGGVATVFGIPKFPKSVPDRAVLIDRPEDGWFPEELLVMPVVEKSNTVHCRRITVTLRNVSSHPVTVKRGMAIAHLFPVDVMNTVPEKLRPHRNCPPPLSTLAILLCLLSGGRDCVKR